MKLEDEIKQKKFTSETQKLVINLLYTGSWIKNKNSQLLKPHGLTAQQYNVLRILRGQYPKPTSVNMLIERMLDKMSNASRLVERLRQKGYVERKECEKDRRQADVVITETGLALLKIIDKEVESFDDVLASISSEEAKLVNDILDKLRG